MFSKSIQDFLNQNYLVEQEDSIRIHFGNLLNILIDRHLKLLYFKVPNRPTPAWYTIQVLLYDQRENR